MDKLLAEAIVEKYFPDDPKKRKQLVNDLLYFADMSKIREAQHKVLSLCEN